MMRSESREAVIQNLKDAGCSQDIMKDFLLYFDGNRKKEQLALLEKHRDDLLNMIHKEEKKISCLDYLVYQIKRTL